VLHLVGKGTRPPPRPLRSRSFECWKPAAVNAPLDRSCSARFRTAYVAGV